MSFVLIDADVLGRNRTGEETYVANLLRELPRAAPELRFGAVTRHPELVPDGVEALALPARLRRLSRCVSTVVTVPMRRRWRRAARRSPR